MARKYLVPIDLTKQELQNARVQNLASAPSSPVAGQIYFNTTDNTLYFYDGTAWTAAKTNPYSYATTGETTDVTIEATESNGTSVNLARADHQHSGPGFGNVTTQTSFGASSGNGSATTVARSDHSHGTPAHDATAHSGIKLSDLAAPTSNINLNSQKITNLSDPVNPSDAANKAYVDGAISGLDWKTSVHLLSATNVPLTGSTGLVIDSHPALGPSDAGYRILLIGQTTTADKGIYVYADNGTDYTLTRAEDANQYQELVNASVFVSEGTAYGKTSWVQANHYLTSFSGQDWVQFSGQGTYLAANGVVLDVNTFKFSPKSDGGLDTGSSGAFVKLQTNSGLGTTSNGLAVGAGTGISVSTGTVAIDTSVVARKYSVAVGDSAANSFTVTHNLNTRDVNVAIRETSSPYAQVEADVVMSTTNTVTVAFAVAPTNNQYTVTVIG